MPGSKFIFSILELTVVTIIFLAAQLTPLPNMQKPYLMPSNLLGKVNDTYPNRDIRKKVRKLSKT